MITPCILYALITVESAWVTNAVSPAGAKGLTQMMPIGVQEVVDQYGLNYRPDLFNPMDSIKWGTLLLQHYLRVAGGRNEASWHLYNGGYRQLNAYVEGRRVAAETRNYTRSMWYQINYCELNFGSDRIWNTEVNYSFTLGTVNEGV
jgi:soluble lytic murein transglycosylase-like protein